MQTAFFVVAIAIELGANKSVAAKIALVVVRKHPVIRPLGIYELVVYLIKID